MTSVVMHLVITILFASLAIKAGPRPNDNLVLDASAGFSGPEDELMTTIEVLPGLSPSVEVDDKVATTFYQLDDSAIASIERPAFDLEMSERNATTPDEAVDSTGDPSASGTASAANSRVDFTSLKPTPDVVEELTAKPAEREATGNAAARPKSELDQIVDRFIQYDIGKLRGAAGDRAHREFMQLGPESIPALVRGLNQSASIRASCPVVVISSKLEQSMQQTNDRALLDYALQNIGRDVPSHAPHASRINSLRSTLAKQFADRQFRQDFAKVAPARNETRAKWRGRVRRLYRADAPGIVAALESDDPKERCAAWAALTMDGRPQISADERSQMAALLLDQWPNHSKSYRKRIHDALTSLAEGSGVGSAPPNFNGRQTNKVLRKWRSWWDENGDKDRESESAELMRLAKYSDSRTSQRLLARTIDRFPNTENAALARHMLTPSSKLSLADDLGQQGRRREAFSLYEEITTDHPDSGEALAARQQLDRLRESE